MPAGSRRIIDAHHHLWDLDAVHYPWLMSHGVKRFFGDPASIQQNYLVSDLRADAGAYDLLASVHVQVGAADGEELAETEWLQRCADEEGLPGAIVAFCDLSRPDAGDMLRRQQRFPAVRGIRQIVGRSPEEDAVTGSGGLLSNANWQINLAALCDLHLAFDLQLIPPQVPPIVKILQTMPELDVALCHCGSPWDRSRAGLAGWRQGLRTLAALPNVHCKISGLGMFNHEWDVRSIRPIVEACVEIFGADRCMFGSNFPVDKLHGSYARVWRAFEEIAGQYGKDEQDQLFVGTAARFYRIQASP